MGSTFEDVDLIVSCPVVRDPLDSTRRSERTYDLFVKHADTIRRGVVAVDPDDTGVFAAWF